MDELLFFESAPATATPVPQTAARPPALPPKPSSLERAVSPEVTAERHITPLSARCGTIYCCGSSGLSLKADRKHGELVPFSDELDSIHKVRHIIACI
jgi:hypothetical protein